MKIQKKIQDGYGSKIYLLMGSDDDLEKWVMSKYHTNTVGRNGDAYFFYFKGNYHVFVNESLSEPNTDHLAVVVHEIVHLTHHILDDIGMRLSNDSEEAYAYHVQRIVLEAMPIFWGGNK
jgi:hypothetical protein